MRAMITADNIAVKWNWSSVEGYKERGKYDRNGSEYISAMQAKRLHSHTTKRANIKNTKKELELELIQTQMAQKPMLRAEVGMRVRCANKASAE